MLVPPLLAAKLVRTDGDLRGSTQVDALNRDGVSAFDVPITLIAGGYDKKLPFEELGKVIAEKVAKLVLLGDTAKKIERVVANAGGGPAITKCKTFEEAVEKAISLTPAPGVILLSPACASYDMFDNFQQRGNLFKTMVRNHADR